MTPLPTELTQVELPLIEQLKTMGWAYLPGSIDDPSATERTGFREVLLQDRLRHALRRINLAPDGEPWLDASRVAQAVNALEHISAVRLLEANERVTELLLSGTQVEGLPGWDDGREQTVRYIDWDRPENNDFLAINQFRVDPPGDRRFSVPDVVLFVNGIPLVVIECKSPSATNPMEEGITQLLRYANQRDWFDGDEGVERLFHYNQLMASTFGLQARVGSISASYEHYLEWKDTSPVPMAQVAASLGKRTLTSQETLVAGMLRPDHLLDIVRNCTLFTTLGSQRIKLVPRYQQFRAIHEAIRRLRSEEGDDRGGIVWHTQGSGKSLTMVFLVRKMRTLPVLRRFKIVVVTDRRDLEKQLSEAAQLSGEVVQKATDTATLEELLRQPGAGLVFAMIQKYQVRDDAGETLELDTARIEDVREYEHEAGFGVSRAAEPRPPGQSSRAVLMVGGEDEFPVLNTSSEILVLVDEAHRSQSSALHANLRKALPNAALIGFTGTPILIGERKRTHEIFGSFIDRYTIQQSEADGATVPILYEGRTANAEVADGRSLDQLFEDLFRDRTPQELEAIKRKYATRGNVLEAPKLIEAKAHDILRHYVDTVLPNGFKAQLVASTRRAAVRYREYLEQARRELVQQLQDLHPSLRRLSPEELAVQDAETQFLVRARRHLDTIRRLEFAAVISGAGNDDPAWQRWSDGTRQEQHIARFKKPLVASDPAKQDGLAFLCVRTMLLTGFDAPIEQVLYLDRGMRGHELLQAIARVNRTHSGKSFGLVVDYFGVGAHLTEALAVYSTEDVEGALTDIRDELPRLRDRHERVLAVFHSRGIENIEDVTACVELLREVKLRAEFTVRLMRFLETLDTVLPRPAALPYVRDAKILGFINKAAANLFRDGQLNVLGAGRKVRDLIDEYLVARGVDPRVPPISILDSDFEKVVDGHVSSRTKASEMEHAARYHISKHAHEDPAHYKKLSERLEEILKSFEDSWDQLVEALHEFTREVREGRPEDESGLDLRTQAPFLGVLLDEVAGADVEVSPETLNRLARVTVEMVDHIRQEIRMVDFWRNQTAQDVLRMSIVRLLDDHDAVPFEKQRAAADRIVELAHARHRHLVG
jgi:type I restriction enzyme, R subunit